MNRERRWVPICNIVILLALTVHDTLNRIALVVQQEDDRLDPELHHNR